MKKTILFISLLLPACLVFSQDVITKKSGEDIKAKVMEVTNSEVKYKKFDFQEGPMYTISKDDIVMIRYENGSKDLMANDNSNNQKVEKSIPEKDNDMDLSEKGREDAISFYTGKNSGAGGTAVFTFLTSPALGLIPAIAVSSTEPSDDHLRYPDSKLMKQAAYSNSYRRQAHKIKRKKVWSAYGVGCGIWLFLILALAGAGAGA